MAAIVTLIALLSLTWGNIEVQRYDGPVTFVDLYGNPRAEAAAMMCPLDGMPVLLLGDGLDIETLAHELAHAYDCLDDNEMNASPIQGWRPSVRPAWASDYCWDTDAEWYACWVTH